MSAASLQNGAKPQKITNKPAPEVTRAERGIVNYFKDNEYYQMVARKEWEDDLYFEATLVEETEEEFEARMKAKGELIHDN